MIYNKSVLTFKSLEGRLSMRMYTDEFTVPSLVRVLAYPNSASAPDTIKPRRTDILSSFDQLKFDKRTANTNLDSAALAATLRTMNVSETRKRRQVYNFVYQEGLSVVVPEKGIPFDRFLKVLAYKLIDSELFLKYILIKSCF